jgi:carbon monoxide dehydrogenase subunit G
MPIAFQVEEYVARPPEVVWQCLTDWERAPEWMEGIDSMRPSGPTVAGMQLVFEARRRSGTSEITHLVPGRELTLTARQGPVRISYRYRCEPEGEGTRVRLAAHCRIRGALRVLGPLLRAVVKRADSGQLRALKRFVEAA